MSDIQVSLLWGHIFFFIIIFEWHFFLLFDIFSAFLDRIIFIIVATSVTRSSLLWGKNENGRPVRTVSLTWSFSHLSLHFLARMCRVRWTETGKRKGIPLSMRSLRTFSASLRKKKIKFLLKNLNGGKGTPRRKNNSSDEMFLSHIAHANQKKKLYHISEEIKKRIDQ